MDPVVCEGTLSQLIEQLGAGAWVPFIAVGLKVVVDVLNTFVKTPTDGGAPLWRTAIRWLSLSVGAGRPSSSANTL